MKVKQWLAINPRGIQRATKNKPNLDWNEIAIQIELDIPNIFFERPVIQAKIKVDDMPDNVFDPEVIINTREVIEQQTGAKIEMSVIHETEGGESI